ncbi:hypothetical protein HOY80DRAFT_541514 [Tuber brumale]|nr:hypothetical protein HOY80DRAFT_541514 [Tuber brumale]
MITRSVYSVITFLILTFAFPESFGYQIFPLFPFSSLIALLLLQSSIKNFFSSDSAYPVIVPAIPPPDVSKSNAECKISSPILVHLSPSILQPKPCYYG